MGPTGGMGPPGGSGPSGETSQGFPDKSHSRSSRQRPDFGPVLLTAASKAMMLNWYRRAQQNRTNKLNMKRKNRIIKDISDDEGDDDIRAPWTKETLQLTPSTIAIAKRWLRNAKVIVQKRIKRKNQSNVPLSSRSGFSDTSRRDSRVSGLGLRANRSDLGDDDDSSTFDDDYVDPSVDASRADGLRPGMRSRYLRK